MFDIIHGIKNKSKFKKKGKELGFENIFFIESFEKASNEADAILIEAKSPRELTKKVAKARGKYKSKVVIILGSNDDTNRAALESKHVDVLLSPEHIRKHDFTHYRNSGLNQVLCKIAAKNNKAIGINFSEIKKAKAEGKENALKLGRIMQNIRLCLKYNVKMLLASFSTKPADMVHALDLLSFARAIGMSPRQAKDSIETMGKIIHRLSPQDLNR